MECALQARIFRSPLRDQDLLVQDEKLNLVVQCLVLYQRQVHSDRNTRPQTRDNHTPPPNPQMKLQYHHPTGATLNFIKMLQLKNLAFPAWKATKQRVDRGREAQEPPALVGYTPPLYDPIILDRIAAFTPLKTFRHSQPLPESHVCLPFRGLQGL